MNDGAFPRADSRDAFNHLLAERKLGDRSVRDDDRYLFLETILAAREVLYLSYQGQSLQDDTEFPPRCWWANCSMRWTPPSNSR